MRIGSRLIELGRFLEACEDRRDVERVALTEVPTPSSTPQVTVDIELVFSPCPSADPGLDVSLVETGVGDGGEIRLSLETAEGIVPERPDGVEIEPADASFGPDGTVSVTLRASTTVARGSRADGPETADRRTDDISSERDVRVDSEGHDRERTVRQPERVTGTRNEDEGNTRTDDERTDRSAVDSDGSSSDRDVPAFRNPELLREVYDSHETFAEMRDALEMDVTAETVRRYMISHGIHDPNSYDTSRGDDVEVDSLMPGADAETPDLIADGIGLPEDLTVDALVETVRRSNTIYEVKTEFGIDREEALELLRNLDLVDHVVGRLAKKEEREVSRELVVERLRRRAEPE